MVIKCPICVNTLESTQLTFVCPLGYKLRSKRLNHRRLSYIKCSLGTYRDKRYFEN